MRILLVDDDEDHLTLSRICLAREEPTLELTLATSAQEALDRLQTEAFDAAIVDYRLRGMTGLALLKQLRTAGNLVPFILFTGWAGSRVFKQALDLGADYCLQKGPDVRETYRTLAELLTELRPLLSPVGDSSFPEVRTQRELANSAN